MKRILLSVALISSFSVACGGGGDDAVAVAEPAAAAAAPTAAAAAPTAAAAAPSTGKSAEAPAASTGKGPGAPAGAVPAAAPSGSFAVGSTVSCNWQNLGMYFSGTIERINGNNISVLYSDGDREETTISNCHLGAAGSIDGDFAAAMEEAAAEMEAAMEEIGDEWAEDWAEEFEDEMEDAMEELNAALEDLNF